MDEETWGAKTLDQEAQGIGYSNNLGERLGQ
jgi:hypothetical protein